MPNNDPSNTRIQTIIEKLLTALQDEPLLEAWAAADAVTRGLVREIEVQSMVGDVERKLSL